MRILKLKFIVIQRSHWMNYFLFMAGQIMLDYGINKLNISKRKITDVLLSPCHILAKRAIIKPGAQCLGIFLIASLVKLLKNIRLKRKSQSFVMIGVVFGQKCFRKQDLILWKEWWILTLHLWFRKPQHFWYLFLHINFSWFNVFWLVIPSAHGFSNLHLVEL